ncbi:hypothetical protein RQN30_10410 [Arcanobacterium hippocoleae]
MVGISAAVLALSTTTRIADFSYGIANSQEAPYDISAERAAQSDSGGEPRSDLEILRMLKSEPCVENVIGLHSFSANILQNENPLVDSVPFLIAEQELKDFIEPISNIHIPDIQPGTLLLPESHAWISANTDTRIQLAVSDPHSTDNDGSNSDSHHFSNGKNPKISDVAFKLAFADVPWPLISPMDAAKLFPASNPENGSFGELKTELAQAEIGSAAVFWIKLTENGKNRLAHSYTKLLHSQTDSADLSFTLATRPTPLIAHNHISTVITVVLLIFTLLFTLLNLAKSCITAIRSSQKQLRLIFTLGISQRQIRQSIMFHTLGITALAAAIGALVGIKSGLLMAQRFIGELPRNYIFTLPWDLAGLVILFSTMSVSVSIWLKLAAAAPNTELLTPETASTVRNSKR